MNNALAIVGAALASLMVGFYLGQQSAAPAEDLTPQLAAIQSSIDELKKAPAAAQPARRRTGPDPDKIHEVKVGGSPSKGVAEAKVTIVEFSDFQCPYCGRVGPTMTRLLKEYPDELRVVYKHLPLSFHQQALPAAKASVAAGRQGKFWEFHDLLFQNQRELGDEKFTELASSLGLDIAKFDADYKSSEVAREVASDMSEARRLGVTGTPGFFVNGKFTSGAKPFESFKAMVDEALKSET